MAELLNNYPLPDAPPVGPPQLINTQFSPVAPGHTAYMVTSEYRFKSGLEVVPAAGPVGTQHTTFRMQAPQMVRITWWRARREDGSMPVAPHPQPSANEVLMNGWIRAGAPVLDQDGQIYSVELEGCYIYGLLLPRTTADGLPLPSSPMSSDAFGQFTINQLTFAQGVLGPIPDPAGFQAPNVVYLGTEGLFA